MISLPLRSVLSTLLLAAALSACGGGGGTSGNLSSNVPTTPVLAQEPGAPALTNNTATDGFNWFNFRRQQAGLPQLLRNSTIDLAAQGHSDYQRRNNTISHSQTVGAPGYTGSDLLKRLSFAGYEFSPRTAYAYGEVISSTGDSSGFYMAEELITAIYHRFVIMEPAFKEAGSGSAVSINGTYYFTTDFAANNGYGSGVSGVVTYPFANQTNVPALFNSDYESPDPVKEKNEVGYPISVHANINAALTVNSFSIAPRGGAPLAVKLLVNQSDAETPRSAAAIIPLNVLSAKTTYDVQFVGSVDGVAVSRSWSFQTR
ncbi:MAG: CAP domain-containing protein [Burkholderiales bacterium]|nr:CAP domain-containing protein [Burkholderiales bacterium]